MLGSYDDKKSLGTITTESKFNPDDTIESSVHYVNRQNGTKLDKLSTMKAPQFKTMAEDTYGTKNARVTETSADETSESGISSSSAGKENQQRVVNSSSTPITASPYEQEVVTVRNIHK